MTIRSVVLGPRMPPEWGPFSCVVDITNARGMARRQLRSVTPTQLSGNVSCPATSILSCPSARILIVESTAYHIASYKDADGQWLDGGNTYKLHVPPNPPAKRFWSATAYDEDTRQMVVTEEGRPDISSRKEGVLRNDDGSVDIYFGPTAPAGKESNWVQTVPNKGWFTYFRFYGPTEPFFDKSWALPDIERVK